MRRCKRCHLERTKANREKNPDAYKTAMQRYNQNRKPGSHASANLKSRYGLTPDERDRLVESQDGVCAICKCPEAESRGGKLFIDHCHETNRVRAALCHRCNSGIGYFMDNPELMREAALYIESYSAWRYS